MQQLVDTYHCEWAGGRRDPGAARAVPALRRHAPTPTTRSRSCASAARSGPPTGRRRIRPRARGDVPAEDDAGPGSKLARAEQFPATAASRSATGTVQIAIYNFARRGEWYATQSDVPAPQGHVLARGLLGDQAGEPKVACPLHKKTFSLETGKGLSDPNYQVRTFPVERRGEEIWVKLPPAESLERELACARLQVSRSEPKASEGQKDERGPALRADRVPRLLDQLLARAARALGGRRFARRHDDGALARRARLRRARFRRAHAAARASSSRSASTSTRARAARRASPRATA